MPPRNAVALVTAHLDLVERIARRAAKRLPLHIRLDDMVSAGREGLLDAAGRFDEGQGASFATFASPRIRGAIFDDIRKQDSLSRDMRALSNRMADAVARLEVALGRAPGSLEVAAELGISVNELHAWRSRLDGHAVVGLEDAGPDAMDRLFPDDHSTAPPALNCATSSRRPSRSSPRSSNRSWRCTTETN